MAFPIFCIMFASGKTSGKLRSSWGIFTEDEEHLKISRGC
jgi:hypothetical protein